MALRSASLDVRSLERPVRTRVSLEPSRSSLLRRRFVPEYRSSSGRFLLLPDGYSDTRGAGRWPLQQQEAAASKTSSFVISSEKSPCFESRTMISHGASNEDKVAKKNSLNRSSCNNNNMKHPSLKRVSFGSSKGSMVETLIYDHPLPEEDSSYYEANITRFGSGLQPKKSESDPEAKRIEAQIRPPSKVKVTFFECEKPHYVSSPESGDSALEFDIPTMSTPSPTQVNNAGYMRQISTDSGKDNPFRPDGDLSREADEIVQLIKGGRPIHSLTPTPELPEEKLDDDDEEMDDDPDDPATTRADGGPRGSPAVTKVLVSPTRAARPLGAYPNPKGGANGNANVTVAKTPEPVEVQRGVVVPLVAEPAQVEHVVIKKKPKCKCCEIM